MEKEFDNIIDVMHFLDEHPYKVFKIRCEKRLYLAWKGDADKNGKYYHFTNILEGKDEKTEIRNRLENIKDYYKNIGDINKLDLSLKDV